LFFHGVKTPWPAGAGFLFLLFSRKIDECIRMLLGITDYWLPWSTFLFLYDLLITDCLVQVNKNRQESHTPLV